MLLNLTTPRLALCPATDADLDALWRLLTDPQVRRYLCDDRVLSRAEVQAMLAESIAQWPAGMGLWMLRGQEDLVGCIGLHAVSPGVVAHAPDLAGEIEPTIALAPDYWSRGYAAEALAAAVAYAFDALGLGHLVAVVDEPNARSHRLSPDRRHRDRTTLPAAHLSPGQIRLRCAECAAAAVSGGHRT